MEALTKRIKVTVLLSIGKQQSSQLVGVCSKLEFDYTALFNFSSQNGESSESSINFQL